MQGQMISFLASDGTLVQVGDESTMVPVMTPESIGRGIRTKELEDDFTAPRKPGSGGPLTGIRTDTQYD
jgi:hypothetical protein